MVSNFVGACGICRALSLYIWDGVGWGGWVGGPQYELALFDGDWCVSIGLIILTSRLRKREGGVYCKTLLFQNFYGSLSWNSRCIWCPFFSL